MHEGNNMGRMTTLKKPTPERESPPRYGVNGRNRMHTPLTDNELWLLSFYRTSEISGALFFGRLAKSMSPGQVQHDMTKHFADESQHAWYWSACMAQLGAQPLALNGAYQDQYVAATGLPANLMEVLALTQVFERRVINQYARHSRVPHLHPAVKATLDTISGDRFDPPGTYGD